MTIGYEIEVHGLDEQIALLEQEPFISQRELSTAMTQSTTLIEANVLPLAPVDRGRLRSGIGSVVTDMGMLNIVGKVGVSLKDEIYPSVMEFGREKGGKMPPIEAIQPWVHRVIRPPEDEERSIAFLVARSIAKNGIKPREYMKKGWKKSEELVKKYFGQAMARITEALSNGRK